MDTRDLKIELLTILADECKKHPAYRALRPGTGRNFAMGSTDDQSCRFYIRLPKILQRSQVQCQLCDCGTEQVVEATSARWMCHPLFPTQPKEPSPSHLMPSRHHWCHRKLDHQKRWSSILPRAPYYYHAWMYEDVEGYDLGSVIRGNSHLNHGPQTLKIWKWCKGLFWFFTFYTLK